MNLTGGSGNLGIEDEREECIYNNRSIILWTNGYNESLNLTVEELDLLISELIEYRKNIGV